MTDEPQPLRGLQSILKNAGTLHHIHEPGEDDPDDLGASEFWKTTVQHAVAGDGFMKLSHAVREELPEPPVQILTTPGIRARYEAVFEQLARERHEAAYEWTRLHWWQWRKRRRLYRKLFGIGGWAIERQEGIPERVTRCGRLKRYRVGGC